MKENGQQNKYKKRGLPSTDIIIEMPICKPPIDENKKQQENE